MRLTPNLWQGDIPCFRAQVSLLYFDRYRIETNGPIASGPRIAFWGEAADAVFARMSAGQFAAARDICRLAIWEIVVVRQRRWPGWSRQQTLDALYTLVRLLRSAAMMDEFCCPSTQYPSLGLQHAGAMGKVIAEIGDSGVSCPELIGVQLCTRSMAYYIAGRNEQSHYLQAYAEISQAAMVGVPDYARYLLARGQVILAGMTHQVEPFRRHAAVAHRLVDSGELPGGDLPNVAILEGMSRASAELLNTGFSENQMGGFSPSRLLEDALSSLKEQSLFGRARIGRSRVLIEMKKDRPDMDHLNELVSTQIPLIVGIGAIHLVEEINRTMERRGIEVDLPDEARIMLRPEDGSQECVRGMGRDSDLFICYNSFDRHIVEQIGLHLRENGVDVWLDRWGIRAGDLFRREIEVRLTKAKCAVVMIGRHGIGSWQALEIDALLDRLTTGQGSFAVVPVVLPDAGEHPSVPNLLCGLHRIDFRVEDTRPWRALVEFARTHVR